MLVHFLKIRCSTIHRLNYEVPPTCLSTFMMRIVELRAGPAEIAVAC